MSLFDAPTERRTIFDEPDIDQVRIVCADCFIVIGEVPNNRAAIGIAQARHALECAERDA